MRVETWTLDAERYHRDLPRILPSFYSRPLCCSLLRLHFAKARWGLFWPPSTFLSALGSPLLQKANLPVENISSLGSAVAGMLSGLQFQEPLEDSLIQCLHASLFQARVKPSSSLLPSLHLPLPSSSPPPVLIISTFPYVFPRAPG